MTPLEAALAYTGRGWPVFPCKPWPDKAPLTAHGFHDASTDPITIQGWWRDTPTALIGMPTGPTSGVNVLDVDVKPERYGWDSLDELGIGILPDVPISFTPGGGCHLHFAYVDGVDIRNTTDWPGPGLDLRGVGGYTIMPTPGSRYCWDPHKNFETTPLLPTPQWLWPKPEPQRTAAPRPTVHGLDRYAEAALDRALRAIIAAPDGQQEKTINSESFSLGTLAGARGIPADLALKGLLWAVTQVPDHDARHRWHRGKLADKVRDAFDAGLRSPRGGRRHG